jgi:sulfur carrier protein
VSASIRLNGRREPVPDGETVAGLLERLGLGARYALVERNGEPVERTRYEEVRLEDGDRLVVARPVAGG